MKNLLIAVLAVAAIPSLAHAASFDCARAAAPDERAVCADPRLSQLDDMLGRAHAQAKTSSDKDDAAKLAIVARGILTERRACGAAPGCLAAIYLGGIESYTRFGSTVPTPESITALDIAQGKAPESSALPSQPGQCSTTRIRSITARLEGEPPGSFESGIAVNFANGGHQVSYDAVPALATSKPGDGAVMCLTAIPRACPPGDDRGRFYTVTNLRTRATWSLPDSQHLCGGA